MWSKYSKLDTVVVIPGHRKSVYGAWEARDNTLHANKQILHIKISSVPSNLPFSLDSNIKHLWPQSIIHNQISGHLISSHFNDLQVRENSTSSIIPHELFYYHVLERDRLSYCLLRITDCFQMLLRWCQAFSHSVTLELWKGISNSWEKLLPLQYLLPYILPFHSFIGTHTHMLLLGLRHPYVSGRAYWESLIFYQQDSTSSHALRLQRKEAEFLESNAQDNMESKVKRN